MPTYEYHCENGHVFEEFQSILDEPLRTCPTCHGRVERHISGGTGLIFKGSGFYVTDYVRKGDNTAGKEDKTPASKPAEADVKSEGKSSSSPSPKDT